MKVLITGGTGFIGKALCQQLVIRGAELPVLSRQKLKSTDKITYINSIDALSEYDVFDTVINLAGSPIADKRWSTRVRKQILESRIGTTKALIRYFERSKIKPA